MHPLAQLLASILVANMLTLTLKEVGGASAATLLVTHVTGSVSTLFLGKSMVVVLSTLSLELRKDI